MALVIGSFVGTVVLRLPLERSLLGRSRCARCDHRLSARDLVPLASWLALRGRCRHCGAWIGMFYPAVELTCLGIALWAASLTSDALLWASCIFGWTLLALSLVDFRCLWLPDALTLPLVPAGLAVAWATAPETIPDCLAGAAAGYAAFAALAWAYRRWRGREGLGGGDAKLLAGIGAWVGAAALPTVVFLASVLALAAALAVRLDRRRQGSEDKVPFGPSLAAAGWIVWLYGPPWFG